MAVSAQVGAAPLVERLQDDEHRREVGAVGLQHERHARDRDRVGHALRPSGDRLDLGHGLLGPLQRRRVGQLDVADDPALVLLRDEARGRRVKDPPGQHQQAAVDQQDEHAAAQQPAHHPAVARGARAEDPVEQPEEPAEQQCPAARSAGRGERRAAAAGWPPGPGLSVSELKAEITVETAMVTANWRKNWPVMPLMKAQGTNTAHSTRATAITGPVTSSIALRAASRDGFAPLQPALMTLLNCTFRANLNSRVMSGIFWSSTGFDPHGLSRRFPTIHEEAQRPALAGKHLATGNV